MPEIVGIYASFFNPEEAGAETAALFFKPTELASTHDLGTPEDVGNELANIAPNGILQEAHSFRDDTGRLYYVMHVQFGGNTAGMFGAAREFRCVTIDKGVQYTLRVTTTRYRYLAYQEVRDIMKATVESLRIL